MDSIAAIEVGSITVQLVKAHVTLDDEADWEEKVVEELGSMKKGDAKYVYLRLLPYSFTKCRLGH